MLMPIRSHIDTWMFCKFINVNENDIDKAILNNYPDKKNKEQLFQTVNKQYLKSQNLIFHETYHFWQGLRLPFLHKYAILMLRGVTEIFASFSMSEKDLLLWEGKLQHPEFYDLFEKFKFFNINGDILFFDTDKQIQFMGPEIGLEEVIFSEFSIIDLLECSASLAEYQFSCSCIFDAYDDIKFDRWQKRNPAYTDVYNFVCKYFNGNKSLVLRLLIPLINASFNTTNPLRAFAEFMTRINSQIYKADSFVNKFIAQSEPCKWNEFFIFFLNQLTFDKKPKEWHAMRGDNSFQALDIEDLIGIYTSEENHPDIKFDVHPILTPLLREWLKLEKSGSGDNITILDCPILNKESYLSIWRNFDTLTIMKFDTVSNPFVTTFFPNDYITKLVDVQVIEYLFAIVGVIRKSTGVNFDNDNHICYHSMCPYFTFNYCNSYLRIPDKFESCDFPSDITNWINYSRKYTNSKNIKNG
jgi:hypothetical protein